MRTLRVLVGIVALLVMSPRAAHADNVQASGTCDTLTVTAPAGSRVIVGLDASPPYEVDDGGIGTFKFFQGADHHVWAATVIVDGAYVDHVEGTVDNCVQQSSTSTETTLESEAFIPQPAAEPQPSVTVSPWVGVELAPPW